MYLQEILEIAIGLIFVWFIVRNVGIKPEERAQKKG